MKYQTMSPRSDPVKSAYLFFSVKHLNHVYCKAYNSFFMFGEFRCYKQCFVNNLLTFYFAGYSVQCIVIDREAFFVFVAIDLNAFQFLAVAQFPSIPSGSKQLHHGKFESNCVSCQRNVLGII